MNIKLYFLSISDIMLLVASAMFDGYLRTIGLTIGIIVGILTIIKLWYDIKLGKLERKIKEKKLKD